MITWRKVSENTTSTFECHEVLCDTNLITLTVLGETRYTVRWYRNGDLDLKKSFDATDLEDAKAYAISAVKEILNYRSSYWKKLEDKFNACLD
jgi:hypothetical protein